MRRTAVPPTGSELAEDHGTVRVVEVERVEPSRVPRYWSVRGVSEHWQISKRHLYRAIEDGRLPAVRVLGCVRIREDDLLHLLEQSRDGGGP